MLTIRKEALADSDAIRNVVVSAFSTCDFGYHGEADIVDRLRENCQEWLSVVALQDDTVVGHVCFSPVTVNNRRAGMGLGPMAVAPDWQRSGVGTELLTRSLQILSEEACPLVVVLGHPDYYPRFGFAVAETFGLSHGFEGIPQEVFFALVPKPDELLKGVVRYRPEFG